MKELQMTNGDVEGAKSKAELAKDFETLAEANEEKGKHGAAVIYRDATSHIRDHIE